MLSRQLQRLDRSRPQLTAAMDACHWSWEITPSRVEVNRVDWQTRAFGITEITWSEAMSYVTNLLSRIARIVPKKRIIRVRFLWSRVDVRISRRHAYWSLKLLRVTICHRASNSAACFPQHVGRMPAGVIKGENRYFGKSPRNTQDASK